jgi:hypothetical protein
MKTDIEPKAGSWILLVGPRSLNSTMLTAIARLGVGGASAAHAAETANGGWTPPWPAVRVLDGGNRFNAYAVARAAGGRQDVLGRITVSRAFTCYQMLSLLEGTAAIPVPFVVLDLLRTFYDESVHVGERKRLLRACVAHLERLKLSAGGVVSVHPPSVPSQAAVELLGLLQVSAVDTFFIQTVAPAPEPARLF